MLQKRVEYAITCDDGDIDHVSWQEARRLARHPNPDILLIERVTRYWEDDGNLVREEEETMYDKETAGSAVRSR